MWLPKEEVYDYFMAPSRPVPSVVVRTPRHASRRLRPSLAAEIRRLAKERDGAAIALDQKGLASDPANPLSVASDNASEWNSMLVTARAERGPQWDVATQRFMVDYGSHLYFDPTPLSLSEESTPPPEDAPPPQDPAVPPAQWQNDLRYPPQYGGVPIHGAPGLVSNPTPARASLRLQQQAAQAQVASPFNGHALGNGIPSPHQYPYGLPNGRQQHFEPGHSFYDAATGQPHHHPVLTNGMMAAAPMMARQNTMGMAMGGNVNMNVGNMAAMGMGPMAMGNMDFGMVSHAMPETPSPGMRTRSGSQLEANMEMGW